MSMKHHESCVMWEVHATKKGRLPVRVEKRPPNKHVTVIFNVVQGQLKLLVALKKSLGTGGATSGASVEVQGDQSKRVENFLLANRSHVRKLSKKEYPIKLAATPAPEAPPLKQRKKPRWQKAKNAGPVMLCSQPLCSWRYCTSSITGECVQQIKRIGIVQGYTDWCSIDEADEHGDEEYASSTAAVAGGTRENDAYETVGNEVRIDYELLSECGMLPTKVMKDTDGKNLGAKKTKMMERQVKRAENYAALDCAGAGPPPAVKYPARARFRRPQPGQRRNPNPRPRPRRKIGRSSRDYTLEDDDYDYESHLYSGDMSVGWTDASSASFGSHGAEYVDVYGRAADPGYGEHEREDDVQRFDCRVGADDGSEQVDGLKDEQVMSFVRENALDKLYGNILQDVSLTCNHVAFWREVVNLMSGDEVAVDDAFVQCLMLFQRTTVTGISWTCSECTYVNVAEAGSCSMCETPLQPSPNAVHTETTTPSTHTDPPPWTCSACTYENTSEVAQCTMCNTPKDGNEGAGVELDTPANPLKQLVDMGFTREAAEVCYSRANGDSSAALELLLTGL